MTVSRRTSLLFLAFLLIAGGACADNTVRAYIPASGTMEEGQLAAGLPGRIYFEITNDEPLLAVSVVLTFASADGIPLWPALERDDFEFLLPEGTLGTTGATITAQGGDWPDTLAAIAFRMPPDVALPAGTYTFGALTVTPTMTGTVTIAPGETTVQGPTRFQIEYGGAVDVDWTPIEVTVVENHDCNGNGFDDDLDIAEGRSLDCDGNGFPDECDIEFGALTDCNENGIPDMCELADGTASDCNANGVPDDCDPDADSDGIPDDCEIPEDCNANGVLDAEDILTGFSADVNQNGFPDECEGLAGDYFLIYVNADESHGEQELVYNRPGKITLALVNSEPISTALLAAAFDSPDGSPIWQEVAGDDFVPLITDRPPDIDTVRQGGDWPDTLVYFQSYIPGGPLEPGFHPLMELTVTPIREGTVSWASAPLEPLLDPPLFVLYENTVLREVALIAPGIEILPLTDCDGNGIEDAIELADGTASDCNGNFVIDACEVDDGRASDCNNNRVPDECEPDDDRDGVPDDCEPTDDCNYNGITDAEDITSGYSQDSNSNGVPDECEGLAGNSIRVLVPRGVGNELQHMVAGEPSEILVAAVNDVEIAMAALPIRYLSEDGTPLWPTLDEADFVLWDGANDLGSFVFFYGQEGTWPDTVIAAASGYGDNLFQVGFNPLFRLKVDPASYGTVTFEAASRPPVNEPPVFVTADGLSEFEVAVEAPPIIIGGCCVGRVGNANMAGGDEPTIGDLSALIDHLFVTEQVLGCIEEADVNGSGGADPDESDITIGDITYLINYLFGSESVLPDCP